MLLQDPLARRMIEARMKKGPLIAPERIDRNLVDVVPLSTPTETIRMPC